MRKNPHFAVSLHLQPKYTLFYPNKHFAKRQFQTFISQPILFSRLFPLHRHFVCQKAAVKVKSPGTEVDRRLQCYKVFLCLGAVQLSSRDVIVRCHDNKMVVIIERENLEDKNNDVFAFSDVNCQARSNKTHLLATAAFDKCGTVEHKEKNGVKHKNILRKITPKTNGKNKSRNHTKDYCPFMDVYVSCWIPVKSRVRVPRSIITTTNAEKVVMCREQIGVGPQIDDGILKRAQLSSKFFYLKTIQNWNSKLGNSIVKQVIDFFMY